MSHEPNHMERFAFYAYDVESEDLIGRVFHVDVRGTKPKNVWYVIIGSEHSMTPRGETTLVRASDVYLIPGPHYEDGQVMDFHHEKG